MSDDAATVLAEMQQLRTRSRRLAHGGAWLPALVLASVPLMSIALYRHPFASTAGSGTVEFPYWAGLPAPQHAVLVSYAFWLVLTPFALTLVAWWYRHRERSQGVRVRAWIPIAAGGAGLLALVALFAAPTGTPGASGFTFAWWQGLLTPLMSVALAAIALGLVERSRGIVAAGVWMAGSAWQFCATGWVGGILGWQDWLLSGGSGPALGGQLGFGMDRPAVALVVMTLPLVLVGLYRGRSA